MARAAYRLPYTLSAWAAMLLLVVTPALAEGGQYPLLERHALARGTAPTGLVSVRGIYLPFADYQELVRGVVTQGDYALRVEGEIFDWRPRAGSYVEFWGELARDEHGYLLLYHNGRGMLELERKPRPTPALAPGAEVTLWLKTAPSGSLPYLLASGRSEDGVVFFLPPDYDGPWGPTCLHGTLQPLNGSWHLQRAKPCPP